MWSEHIGAPGLLEIFIILILALSPKIGGLLKPGEVHNWQNIHWNFASKMRKASRCSSSVQLTTYIHKKRLFTCRDLPNQDSTPEPRRPFGGRSLSVCRMYTTHLLWPHTGRPHMKREISVGVLIAWQARKAWNPRVGLLNLLWNPVEPPRVWNSIMMPFDAALTRGNTRLALNKYNSVHTSESFTFTPPWPPWQFLLLLASLVWYTTIIT